MTEQKNAVLPQDPKKKASLPLPAVILILIVVVAMLLALISWSVIFGILLYFKDIPYKIDLYISQQWEKDVLEPQREFIRTATRDEIVARYGGFDAEEERYRSVGQEKIPDGTIGEYRYQVTRFMYTLTIVFDTQGSVLEESVERVGVEYYKLVNK